MNMSDYNCGAIKLNNGPNGRRKLPDFLDWILTYGSLKAHLWTPKGFKNSRLRNPDLKFESAFKAIIFQ